VPYDGLPVDAAEALARRNERIEIVTHEHGAATADTYWREAPPVHDRSASRLIANPARAYRPRRRRRTRAERT